MSPSNDLDLLPADREPDEQNGDQWELHSSNCDTDQCTVGTAQVPSSAGSEISIPDENGLNAMEDIGESNGARMAEASIKMVQFCTECGKQFTGDEEKWCECCGTRRKLWN